MVNARNPASPDFDSGKTNKAKGKGKQISPGGPSVTRGTGWKVERTVLPHYSREASPGKSVHFGQNLIQGPFVSDPARRSQSPTRPALHKRDPTSNSPSAQLLAEHSASHAQTPGGKRKRNIDDDDSDLSSTDQSRDVTDGRGINGTKGQSRQKRIDARESLVHAQQYGARNVKRTADVTYETSDEDPIRKDSVLGTTEKVPTTDSIHSISAGLGELDDNEVCTKLNELRSMIIQLAESFAAVLPLQKASVLHSLLWPENAHLVKHISCIAMGGKSGIDGWCELLADTTCRHALVVGIIARSLKENVFSELYFGGSEALVERLRKQEQQQAHQDGFFRTRERAAAISKYRAKSTDAANLRRVIARVTLQLERMLLPLWNQGANSNGETWRECRKRHEIARIVAIAASLSRSMRASSDVVYYWPPTFKDEEFEVGRMECFNLKAMITESPYDKKSICGFDRAVLSEGQEHRSEAVVRIVCFPALVAYRQHGGELARHELAEEEARRGGERLPSDVQLQRKRVAMHENSLTGEEGFRTRTLCKSVVLLQWGKQRLLTKEAGTSRHIDAMNGKGAGMKKYEDDYDGFVELYDLFETVTREGKTLSQVQKDVVGTRTPSLVSSMTRLFSRSPSASAIPVVNREHRGE